MSRDVWGILVCLTLLGVLAVREKSRPHPEPAPVDLALLPIPCVNVPHLPGNPFVIPCPCQ